MPFFRDVVGQDEAKRLLLGCAHDGKMPHALLFAGKLGTGKLPLALALSRYLLCQHLIGRYSVNRLPEKPLP